MQTLTTYTRLANDVGLGWFTVLRRGMVAICLIGMATLASASEGEELRIVLQGDIKGTNPGVTRDGNTDTVIHHMVESLVAYREDLSVVPHLAERIEVSPDLTQFTFHLRDNVRFHNGKLMTSEQVKWSWERMLDPATRWRCRHWYDGSNVQSSKITAIETPDAHTVVFQLDKPSSVFLDRMANVQCVTAILHPDSVAADGTWIRPIGTGPYKFNEWARGEYILLERFEDYSVRAEPRDGYAGARIAKTSRVRFVVIGDVAIGVAGILSGDIDVLPLLPLHLVRSFEQRRDLKIRGKDRLSWSVLLMQTEDPLLKDIKIRQAIAHAINIEQVAIISTFSNASANPSAVPEASPYYSGAHRKWWPYDPQKARRLLVEAGYDGAELTIRTNRKIPYMYENAVAIQAMLTAVGINARLEVVDWATQLGGFFKGDFQLSAFGYSGRTHPSLNYDAFLGLKREKPNLQWEDQDMLALLGQAERETNFEKRKAIYERIHQQMYEAIPIIGLFNEYGADVTRIDIEGYEPWVMGRPRLWGVSREAQ